MAWGAEWKKGYDRKEEREGKVMIMTNYYCESKQRGETRRGKAATTTTATREVHSTYTHLLVSLSVEVVLLIDPSIRTGRPASRRRSSCAMLLYIMCFFCVLYLPARVGHIFATTLNNNNI